MLPRFRSFYGKVFACLLIALCFLIYIKVLQVDDATLTGSSASRQHAARERLIWRSAATSTSKPAEQAAPLASENEVLDEPETAPEAELARPESAALSSYEALIRQELAKQVAGLGDNGEAVHLEGVAKQRGEQVYKRIALNEELSEQLSYNRTVGDHRHPACQQVRYDVHSLPNGSIVIIFYNEPFSVLLRTVHSVLNTCSGRLLNEIILVDDGSTNAELHGKLDHYIRTRLPDGKVKVIRLKNRLGLIRARLAGARLATGDVLVFLDAHCEANVGWFEPLLQRIKESRTSVLVPIIDVIDANDFQYSTNGYKSFQVGGFQWSGHFDWVNVPERERQRQKRECKQSLDTCPTYSPTMAGGLFAIDRRYFWESGSYDEQMDGWGGENLEMSFRIWQCGGTIETIPCSRVGHVFRDFHPYKFPNDRDTHGINTARMALVWMDDYTNVFFTNRPDLKFHPEIGDITHRVILRKKLHCKSFDWYLKNIYPEKFLPHKNAIAYGRVKSTYANLCLDDLLQDNEKPYNMGLYTCGSTLSKSQLFTFTKNRVLRNELSCATVHNTDELPLPVVMAPCLDKEEYNEKWDYSNGHLKHINSGLCLDHYSLKSSNDVQVTECDETSKSQFWVFNADSL